MHAAFDAALRSCSILPHPVCCVGMGNSHSLRLRPLDPSTVSQKVELGVVACRCSHIVSFAVTRPTDGRGHYSGRLLLPLTKLFRRHCFFGVLRPLEGEKRFIVDLLGPAGELSGIDRYCSLALASPRTVLLLVRPIASKRRCPRHSEPKALRRVYPSGLAAKGQLAA